jgi:hypothetical protein
MLNISPLSQFTVVYQPDKHHFRQVTAPHLFETHSQSPQLEFWRRDAVEWHAVRRLPDYASRQRMVPNERSTAQLPLFPLAADG